jgi:hypothetical protein
LKLLNPGFDSADFTQQLFRFFGIVPKIRRMRNLFFIFNFGYFMIDVKDTSLALLLFSRALLSVR